MPESLSKRNRIAELMDDPSLDAASHEAALRGLARLNRWSRSVGIVWPGVARAAGRLARGGERRPVRVLDLATASGDVPVGLWRRARRRGWRVQAHGVDVSPRAVATAQAAAARFGAHDDLTFAVGDALNPAATGPGPDGQPYDVVMANLFLHHLDEPSIVALLKRMRELGRVVIVNDLRRDRWSYALAWGATRCLTRSPVVHVDGPRSVQAALSQGELGDLAEEAGLAGALVERVWPCRLRMIWEAP